WPVPEWLSRQLPRHPRAIVVRGHVDLDVFRPQATPRAQRTVLFAGKLDPKKGLDVLIDALDRPELRDWRLLVCSPLPPVAGFESWQHDVLDRMRAHPRVEVLLPLLRPPLLARLYASAAVVAVPSVGDEALGAVSPAVDAGA